MEEGVSEMIYKKFKDIELSTLGMGNMRLPTVNDVPHGEIDYVQAQKIIDYAMSHGINYYDTAYTYPGSEKFLGEAMKKYPRDSYHLATKYWIDANPDYAAVFEEQLATLQTDYIDFYLIHSVMEGFGTVDQYIASGCIEYFMEQKRKERIRYLGFSSHALPESLRRMADYADWDFAQIQLNYLDWACGTTKEEYEILTERNIPVMVMEPIRGGRLATLPEAFAGRLQAANPDWNLPSWALRFVRRLPNVQVILSGMSTLEQIRENVATFSDATPMTEAQAELVLQIARDYRSSISVACTGCAYCVTECPKKLEIPKFMELYNHLKYVGYLTPPEIDEMPEETKPHNCIGCAKCTHHCPQGLPIPAVMKELKEWEGKNSAW